MLGGVSWIAIAQRPLARCIVANGALYMAVDALLYAAPQLAWQLLLMPPLAPDQVGQARVVGMAVLIIGWFHVIGGRTWAHAFALSTVVDRLLVPAFLVPLYLTGQLGLGVVLAFSILDPTLGLIAYAL